ncbi:MAG: MFS transporter, partial [Flavobacteriales bacterium]|nr:MFS transporter [Flavobacteriales bacterium]
MNPPKHHFQSSFTTLISVFFFWGFVAASNGVFIPFCKHYFQLDQLQSQLIDTSFYGAYFYGALLLFIVSYFAKFDILNKIGYKGGIVTGLFISVAGALGLAYTSSMPNPTFGM